MKKSHSRVLAAATALIAGGLAAFALRPATTPSSQAVASRNPAAEVRTQVIRRTIHIKRHQPAVGAGGHGTARFAGSARGVVRSGASGSHASGSVASAVATRTSGSHAVGVPGTPVATRTSGSVGAATSGTAVRTRTSGAAGAGGRPTTRSSGGGERGDGGGD